MLGQSLNRLYLAGDAVKYIQTSCFRTNYHRYSSETPAQYWLLN